MKLIAVDEVKAKRFVLFAVSLELADKSLVSDTLLSLRLRGQTRVHFVDESDRRRKQILAEVSKLPVRVHFFVCSTQTGSRAREASLKKLIEHLPRDQRLEILIEQDENYIGRDRSVLQRELFAAKRLEQVSYRHVGARQEPLVWIPDMYAWVVNRGGSWKRHLADIQHEFVFLD